jgi:hypothetical protein
VAWAAIVVTIAKAFPFVKNYVPAEWGLTDGIVALLAIVVLATVHVRKDLKADTTRILEKLEGPEFRRFATSEEQIFHIARQINKAEDSICDVTWVDYLGPERSSPVRESAQRALDDAVIAFSAHKPYREIFIFDGIPDVARQNRLKTLKKRTEALESGYYCAFMKPNSMPRLQFMVIDDEVMLRGFEMDVGDVRCSIRDKDFARLFRAYYARLWRASTVLKDERTRNDAALTKLIGTIAGAT